MVFSPAHHLTNMKLTKPILSFRKRHDFIHNNMPNYPGMPYGMFRFAQRIRNAVEGEESIKIISDGITREIMLDKDDQ